MAEKPEPHVVSETPKSEPEKKLENGGPKNRHDLAMAVAENAGVTTPDVKEEALTEKETKLFNEYKKTDELLGKAREKFVQVEEMLKNDPKGEPLKVAVNLYNEARERIKNILPNLGVLDIEWGVDVSFVNDAIAKINVKSEELKSEILKVVGLDVSHSELAHLDAMSIIRSVKKMRKLGLNDNESLHLLEFTKKEKIYELIGYIEKAKKLNIEPHTAGIFFLDNVLFSDLELVASVGIKSSKDICTVVYGMAKNYEGGNVKAMVEVMKLLNITTEGELQELQMMLFKCKLDDVIKKVEEMKKRGVNDGYISELYETMSVENADYIALKEFLKSDKNTMYLSKTGLAAKEMLVIARKLEASGVKDVFKFIKTIIDAVNSTDGGDFMSVYRIAMRLKINSIDGLLSLYNYKKHFHLKDIDVDKKVGEIVAAGIKEGCLDLLLATAAIEKPNYDLIKKLMPLREVGVGMKKILALSESKDIWETIRLEYLQNPVVKIIFAWGQIGEVPNKDQIKAIVKFVDGHLGILNKFYIEFNAGDSQWRDLLKVETKYACDFIKWYLQQSPEMQDFADDLMNRQHVLNDGDAGVGFGADPSLPICLKVYKNMEKKDVEEALRFGRTLYYQGIKILPDKVTLEKMMKNYKEGQASADKIKIFEGRNVVFVANGEMRWDGKAFADESRQKDLKGSIGAKGTKSFYSPSDQPTFDELKKVKEDVLEAVITTPPPMTFFFDGHGGPDALYINNGQLVGGELVRNDDMDTISFKELAAAITKRKEKFSGDALDKDIYINAGCFNHTFIRNLYAEIKLLGGVAPITIGEAEYGQVGSGNKAKYKNMYQLGTLGTTIGNLRENQDNWETNFTVYVPDDQGRPVQVVKGENGKVG